MDELGFDIDGLLSPEEADKLFEEQAQEETTAPDTDEKEVETEPTEETEETQEPETVGGKKNEDGSNAITQESDGSSPNVYSSIASALKNDGIFPDFSDDELNAVQTPEDFAELFDKAVTSRLDERMRRIDSALGNGVAPDTVKQYEQTLQYLGSINEEALSSETNEGEELRKQLIYNDLVARGYSHDKALRELDKSFKSGSDVEDAKDALESLTNTYKSQYQKMQDDAKRAHEQIKDNQKKQAEELKKMILDDEVKLGDTKLDKRTCQRVYDAITKPAYKDKEGRLFTAVQQFQKEHPQEFLKQIGMWYVLTDGGKNMDGFTKQQLKTERNKAIKELGAKINTSSFNRDGSLKYVSGSGTGGDNDPLLSDGWKVGW